MERKRKMGLADLHIHTIYSYDASSSVPAVLCRAKTIGLDVIAITDHDEINGALLALELAPTYGIEVIPGIEVSTSEGDLIALNITERVPRDLPLVDTVLKVADLGGFCIAPHPMAGGLGMKSLSAFSTMNAIRNPNLACTLLGIETCNATALDRKSSYSARILAERLKITQLGNSDAHTVDAIGLAVTEFEGSTAIDLLTAIREGKTLISIQEEWSSTRILGNWAANYLLSAVSRVANGL
jgi:predicted metal-dependent phosphoesterase TrpH